MKHIQFYRLSALRYHRSLHLSKKQIRLFHWCVISHNTWFYCLPIILLHLFHLFLFQPCLLFLSTSESDPSDPALFLSVLLYADLTVEEMFCLILKCEESCGQAAKSHYSPPRLAVLREAYLRRRQNRRERQRKNMFLFTQTDEWPRFQTQASRSKLIGGNWLVKYFLMPWPCRTHSSCTLFNRCPNHIFKKASLWQCLNVALLNICPVFWFRFMCDKTVHRWIGSSGCF